jgi:hypothetical protein
MRSRRTLAGVVGALAVAVGSPACGGHSSPPAVAGPCAATARATIARAAGTTTRQVTATGFVAPSGAAGCRFGADGTRVLATIDAAPQAEQRFERAVVEYGQNVLWAHLGAAAYPQDIAGLGVGADWFAADQRLLATDGARLLDITVTWPAAAPADARRLAQTLARSYIDAHPGARGD